MTEQIEKTNPASAETIIPGDRKRIPMSVPLRKLEVAKIPGFVQYWFREANVSRAIQGGYEFVDQTEVTTNQHSIGASAELSGSTSLGSRVTIHGGFTEQGKPEDLVLMKIKEEWWNEDQAVLGARNVETLKGIFRGEDVGATPNPGDASQRYTKDVEVSSSSHVGSIRDGRPLFQRPTRKEKP